MKSLLGVILLEKYTINIRLYEVANNDWKLVYAQTLLSEPADISMLLARFFTSQEAQHVTTWKIGSRGLPKALLNCISAILGLEIDTLSLAREQELLCKGLFTELW